MSKTDRASQLKSYCFLLFQAHGLLEDCTPKKAAVSAKGLEGQSIKGSGTKNPQRRHGKSSVKSMKNKKRRVNDQHSHNEVSNVEDYIFMS